MITFDQATVDSSGAFLIGELERLDQTLNLPLVGYTWTRDIQLREDVSIADDISSWTNTSFAAAGTGANPNGKNWVGKDSTAIAGVNVDIGKSGNPLNLWGMELGWTVIELQAAQQVGRPIDTQKYDGMQLKWQMDNDEQVYVGDSALNLKGLVTLDGVPVNNAAKTWATSTPDEIRASINQVLSDAWAASGYSVVPRDLLIPPEQFALLSSIIVSSAGNQSLLTYLQTNTISYHQNGVPLNIRAVKWLKGRGVGKKDRMVAYTNDKKYVRYGSASSEEGIVVAMGGPKNTMTIGADGEVMHSLHADKSGTITVNLLKTSPTNKKLSLAYNAQSQSSATWGNNVIVIRNKVSGDIITARSVAFQKQPDNANAKTGNTMPWVFDCGKIDQVLGEF